MAIPAQGLIFTWGGAALAEVVEFDVSLSRGLPLGRVAAWTSQWGAVRIIGLSAHNLPGSEYGKRKTLTITAPGGVTLFSQDCIYVDSQVQAVANDAVRFAFTFTIQDTTGAPSNP